MPSPVHSRSPSHSSTGPPPRSPSPPSQTFHPSLVIHPVPTPSLLESVAGAAHYSGIRVDGETSKHRRRSSTHHIEEETFDADHQQVLNDLKELYCCRPTAEIIERSFRKDATFEDPLVKCSGSQQIAAQFFAMPKLFCKSETLGSRVMSSTKHPNQVVYWQKQQYTSRWLGRNKVIESVIVVDLDEDEKIIRLLDQWDGANLPSWFGSQFLRSASAKVTPWLIHVPKSHS